MCTELNVCEAPNMEMINEVFNDEDYVEEIDLIHCDCCDEDYDEDQVNFHCVIVSESRTEEEWCEECVENHASWSEYYEQYISNNVSYITPMNAEDMIVLHEDAYTDCDFYYSNHYDEWLYRPEDESDYVELYDGNNDHIDYVAYREARRYYYYAYDQEQWYDSSDYLYYSELDDNYYWYEYNMPEEEESGWIRDYHDHKGEFVFVGDSEDICNEEMHLGFELEIENSKRDYCNDDVCEYIDANDKGLFVFENDGSLSTGFECITNITTLKFLEENYDTFNELCKGVAKKGMRSHDTSTCGLHIHINRAAFGETLDEQNETIQKVIMLVEGHMKEITRFARRAHDSYARFRCSEQEWNEADIEGKKQLVKDKWYYRDHCLNVNLQHEETVEFRMFKGTLKWETLFMSIVFCYNLIKCAKDYTEDDLPELNFDNILNANPKYATRMQEYYELCRPRWN